MATVSKELSRSTRRLPKPLSPRKFQPKPRGKVLDEGMIAHFFELVVREDRPLFLETVTRLLAHYAR